MSEQSEKHGQGAYIGKYIPTITPSTAAKRVMVQGDGYTIYHRENALVNAWLIQDAHNWA
jgi:hypothetical protein